MNVQNETYGPSRAGLSPAGGPGPGGRAGHQPGSPAPGGPGKSRAGPGTGRRKRKGQPWHGPAEAKGQPGTGRRERKGAVRMTQQQLERDEQAVGPFIERFASVLVEAGVPPMPARVFSALLVTDSGRLTAAELAELLGASPAAISGAVRYLEQVGMISRQREPGSRRDVYLLRNNLWYEISLGRDQVLAHWANAARDGAQILGPDTPAGQRLADSHDFFAFLRQELPALLERWRAHKAQHG